MKAIAERLFAIIGSLQPLGSSKEVMPSMFCSHDVAFEMQSPAARELNAVVDRLRTKQDWGLKFSEEYIKKAVHTLLAEALRIGSDSSGVARLTDEMCQRFAEFRESCRVYVPIEGLVLRVPSLELGSVVLVSMSEDCASDRFSDLAERRLNAIRSGGEATSSTPDAYLEMLKTVNGKTCVEYEVVAEPVRATELAEEAACRIVDALRFAIPAVYDSGLAVRVGLEGDASPAFRTSFAVQTAQGRLYSPSRAVGAIAKFEIDEKMISRLRELGVFQLAQLSGTPPGQLTDLCRSLLRAVHWFGDAQMQCESENHLLSLVTCLECLFTRPGGSPISSTIAEGTALLLTEDPKGREYVYRFISSMYGKRNSICHGGNESVQQHELQELTSVVGSLILKILELRNEYPTRETLLGKIRELKFS